MKKGIGFVICLALVILCAAALADVKINETNFPDEIFRNIVKSFDKDKNNKLSEAEIANVQQVYVYSQSIKSLKGVEYFTLLKELYCSRNQLTSLSGCK